MSDSPLQTIYHQFLDSHPSKKRNIVLLVSLLLILSINLVYFLNLSEKYQPPEPLSHQRVLVTGAAGFIGFHLSRKLHALGNTVVAIDSFNDYYDQELKRIRANTLLDSEGINVIDGNICDKQLLLNLFREHKFTHVAHLAAQAGVRYSLENPQSYITNNLMCTTTLLEVVREVNPKIIFVYASSSSVYGRNKKVPFSEKDPVNHPSNIYGASKRANEQWALVYHDLFGIKTTGLRFFTVYGAYGRPDMAIYLWSNAIAKDEPIPLYEKKDSFGKNIILKRDFTHVDDIVDGIVGSLSLGADFEIFNLGNNTPEPIVNLISYLAESLGRANPKTKIKPLPAADITQTYADISHANKLLGFKPKTSLKDGVELFVQWYREYYFPTNLVYVHIDSDQSLMKWFSSNKERFSKNTHIYILHPPTISEDLIHKYTRINIRFRPVDSSLPSQLAAKMADITQSFLNSCPKEEWKVKRVVAVYDSPHFNRFVEEALQLNRAMLVAKSGVPIADDEAGCESISASFITNYIGGSAVHMVNVLRDSANIPNCFFTQVSHLLENKYRSLVRKI